MSNIDFKLFTPDNIYYVSFFDDRMTIGIIGIDGYITYHKSNNKVFHVKYTGKPLEVADENVIQIIQVIAAMCSSHVTSNEFTNVIVDGAFIKRGVV